MQTKALIIGTRGSPLARAQAELAMQGLADVDCNYKIFTTSGDKLLDKPLVEFGGKGLFTKELDDALLKGEIDCAVHSAKDLPAELPDGIVIACVLQREDPRDVFVGRNGLKFADLPEGATIGTASLRRAAQLQRLRPDITTALLRGNVGTRLKKVEEQGFHGTILAAAGLNRLGLQNSEYEVLSLDDFLPAAGQGTLAITARADDTRVLDLLRAIHDVDTTVILSCERAFIYELGASCRMALSAYAYIEDGEIVLNAQFYGDTPHEDAAISISGDISEAEQIGIDAATSLLLQSPALGELLNANELSDHTTTARS